MKSYWVDWEGTEPGFRGPIKTEGSEQVWADNKIQAKRQVEAKIRTTIPEVIIKNIEVRQGRI